tara:strand:- start:7157 stop:7396 length:240 start_codon:yes stop_codon:yes gene_type:complete
MPSHKTFGEWVSMNMQEMEMTQKEVAKEIAVSQNAISSWVRDYREPSIRNFIWLCKLIALKENRKIEDVVLEAIEIFLQ